MTSSTCFCKGRRQGGRAVLTLSTRSAAAEATADNADSVGISEGGHCHVSLEPLRRRRRCRDGGGGVGWRVCGAPQRGHAAQLRSALSGVGLGGDRTEGGTSRYSSASGAGRLWGAVHPPPSRPRVLPPPWVRVVPEIRSFGELVARSRARPRPRAGRGRFGSRTRSAEGDIKVSDKSLHPPRAPWRGVPRAKDFLEQVARHPCSAPTENRSWTKASVVSRQDGTAFSEDMRCPCRPCVGGLPHSPLDMFRPFLRELSWIGCRKEAEVPDFQTSAYYWPRRVFEHPWMRKTPRLSPGAIRAFEAGLVKRDYAMRQDAKLGCVPK